MGFSIQLDYIAQNMSLIIEKATRHFFARNPLLLLLLLYMQGRTQLKISTL